MRKKGFYKETTYQLILIFITLVFLGILVGSIFSGINLQNALCKAIPWLCGERQDVDYEISLKSTQNAICAVGSAFLKRQWDGGLDCNWGEPETNETGGSEATGRITGFAASEDKELEISEARKLQSSFNCGTDETGKFTCTVNNFIMPQEVTDAEDYILFWGDPFYLVYWGSFPHEEDTWNFKVNWLHHGAIAILSVLPIGKIGSIGFKTVATAVKGPSKGLLAREAAEMIWKNTEKLSLTRYLGKQLYEVAPDKAGKILGKTVKELGEEEIEILASNLGKIPKKSLKTLVSNVGGKTGRLQLAKKLMTTRLADELKKKLTKEIAKKPAREGLKILGKIAVAEAGIHILAESQMKKYDPVGNAMAIKNPGNETEDLETFSLPDEMKGKPVLVRWKPGITWGLKETQIKHAHFASPCYLKEFNVTREDNIVCGLFIYNRTGNQLTCEDAKISNDAPLECDMFDPFIDEKIGYKIYDKIEKFLELGDKKLFEFDDYWNLTKINLAWFMNDDETGSKYQLKEFEFISRIYKPREISPIHGITTTARRWSTDVKIGDKFIISDVVGRSYEANLSEGSKDLALIPVENEDKDVMKEGKEYVLHIYIVYSGDVIADVYDLEMCDKMMDIPEEEPYDKQLSCDEIRSQSYSEISGTPQRIKEEILDVQGKSGDVFIRLEARENIKAGDIDELGGIDDCGRNFLDSQNCFRILDKITVYIECEEKGGSQFYQKIHEETCEIDMSILEKEIKKELGDKGKITFKRVTAIGEDIEPEGGGIIFNYNITDVHYSTQFYEIDDGDSELMVGFEDSDENDQWDLLILENKKKPKFEVTFSDIKDNGYSSYISMKNCKTEGVIITFEDDDLTKAKIDIEGGEENYCMRQSSKFAKYFKIGAAAGGIVATVAATIISGGSVTVFYIAGGVSAGTEFIALINYERSRIWPRSAGG